MDLVTVLMTVDLLLLERRRAIILALLLLFIMVPFEMLD